MQTGAGTFRQNKTARGRAAYKTLHKRLSERFCLTIKCLKREMEPLCPSQSTTELCDTVRDQTFPSSWTPAARLHASASVGLCCGRALIYLTTLCIARCSFIYFFMLYPSVLRAIWVNCLLCVLIPGQQIWFWFCSRCRQCFVSSNRERQRVRNRRLYYRAENGNISFSFQQKFPPFWPANRYI